MNDRLSWLLLSFPLPSLGSLRIRVNLFFLLFAAVFSFRFGMALGLIVIGILLVSVFLHELGHVLLARLTGGSATEIHLTPLGGLAAVHPVRGMWPHVLTAAAGPLVNLLICSAVFVYFSAFSSSYMPEPLWNVVRSPLVLPVHKLSDDQLLRDLALITFAINWLLLLVNVLPVLPLDGGQIVRAVLATRMHPELVGRSVAQFGIFASATLMLAGLFGDWSAVVFLGAILLLVNLLQLFEEETSDQTDDSFLGYDFSEGYTSFERSAPASAPPPREAQPGLLQRWRDQRRQRREQEERRQQADAERQLDALLAKVHEHGMTSLTSREQHLLKTVSDLLRERGKRPS